MKTLQGQLLIASPGLRDPNFVQSVILLVQHDENGALGVVVNRPSQTPVQKVLEDVIEGKIHVEGVVHHGGPCEGPLMVIHTHGETAQIDIGGGLYFTTERSDIERLVTEYDGAAKFFANYAGWGPGQLEGEIEDGSWRIYPAVAGQVFGVVSRQWSKLLLVTQSGGRLTPEKIPEDPTVN